MSLETNRENYAEDLAYEYDLTLPQARGLAALAIHSLDPTFAPDSPRHLADPAVADAFVTSPLGPYATADSVARLDDLAVRAIANGYATAGAWYARACVAEHRGSVGALRAHLAASLAIDPGFWPSLDTSGFVAFVEGDERTATRLLRGSPKPTAGPMLHTLSHYPSVGSRSDRRRDGRYPLRERAVWLWEKAATWLHRLPRHGDLLQVAAHLTGVEDPLSDDPELLRALDHPLFETAALLELGLLRRFLDDLGRLLPPDERRLAERWATARHRVWRVDATTPGRSLRLIDLLRGDVVDAHNGAVSRCTQPGEIVFGLVLPAGKEWLLAAHPVPLTEQEAVVVVGRLDVDDPCDLAAYVYRLSHDA